MRENTALPRPLDGGPHAHLATSVVENAVETWRVMIVGGVAFGVIVAGLGSRLAMFLLRVTSPPGVRGLISDDGFTIGQVTASGTYNLLVLGAAVGLIGAAAYLAVSPRLLGPLWFRRFTVAAASGAVVGSMLLHADGVDFKLLKPTWLAIGLFVGLPAVFGWGIGVAVDAVRKPGHWTGGRRTRWLLPAVLLLLFPFVIPIAVVALGVVMAWRAALTTKAAGVIRGTGGYGLVVRAGWLAVAVMGLIAVVRDIAAIA